MGLPGFDTLANIGTLGAYGAITGRGGPFGGTAGPSGVGGPAADPTKLMHDPVTGMYFDPTTGTSYMDPSGQNPIKDPNVAQQVSKNVQTSQAFLQQTGADRGMVTQAYNGETGLASSLNNTITNPNASSVAQTQLSSGMDALGRNQLSQAAGVGGPNAAAARRQASLNIGQQGADLVQAKAGVRANEVAGAQGNLATVLGNQASQGHNQYGTDVGAGGQFATLASGGAAQQQGDVLGVDTANRNRQAQGVGAALNGASAVGAKVASGGAA